MADSVNGRYKYLQKIGEGVHGMVLKAQDLTIGKVVAIKKVSLRTKHGEISLSTVREIKALQHCECKYIMSLLDVFPDMTGLSLVFEFMPHTLYSILKNDSMPLSRSTIRSYASMLLHGVNYMHNIGIMHRDIKPANLLIDENNVLKIADFGLARIYSQNEDKSYSPQVASRWYRAPELLYGSSKYGSAVDMWAIGCVFAEMLRRVPLFNGNTDIEQLALVIKILGNPNIKDWPEINSLPDFKKIHFSHSKGESWQNVFPTCTTANEIALVDGLIQYNPKKRLTAAETLNLDYFTQFDGDVRKSTSKI
ncbi:cyclin-dependent kinase 20-like [Sitodiplosis mosellana]|uniref:cyclin-dependent kinase 20-like n=1 Tax=Sitodiplosis mosellana TaxID=263140 RepID=UPI002444C695|nr:cyclin-dependent kinase 20-like [Sitodiplosis mosellana]